MKKQTGFALILFYAGVSCLFPLPAFGIEKIFFQPSVTAGIRYDSNYFKTETAEREILTYTARPRLELGYTTDRSRIFLDYALSANAHSDMEDIPEGQRKAGDEDYIGHNTRLEAATRQMNERLTLKLEGIYYDSRDPLYQERINNSTTKDRFTLLRFSPSAHYELSPRFSLGLTYRNTGTEYDRYTAQDFRENSGTADIFFELSPTAVLDLEYRHWETDYKRINSDYDSDRIVLMYRRKSENLSLEGGIGYHQRRFEQNNLENMDMFYYRFAIGYETLSSKGELLNRFTFSADRGMNDYSVAGDHYMREYRYMLTAKRIFFEKIAVELRVYYAADKYERWKGPTPGGSIEMRDDDVYNIGAELDYDIRDNLTIRIFGGHDRRDSNLAGLSYDNSYAFLSISYTYDTDK